MRERKRSFFIIQKNFLILYAKTKKVRIEFGTSIISIDRYFVNASEVAILSCMNGPISFLHTAERKERPLQGTLAVLSH